MARNNPVQFSQCLDLVDDHLAHLRGAVGRFLWHLEHAATKLFAGHLEFVVHFRSHLLHALDHRGELVG